MSLHSAVSKSLLSDTMRWSFSAVLPRVLIGLSDQFNLGCYSWADGRLFRPEDVNASAILTSGVIANSLVTHAAFNLETSQLDPADSVETFSAGCQRDSSYLGCYKPITPGSPLSPAPITSHIAMTLTQCHQLCQGQGHHTFFVGQTECYCEDGSYLAPGMIEQMNDTDPECSLPCPGHSLQKCGSDGKYRMYILDEDIAASCQDLYNNFVTLPGTYLTASAGSETCQVDDRSITCAVPGAIAIGGHGYSLQFRQDVQLQSANQECQSRMSDLAFPLNSTNVDNMATLIKSFASLSSSDLWGVGHFRTTGGRYVSSVGHLLPHDAPMMATLDPSNSTSKCVAINITSSTLQSVMCDSVIPFVCQESPVSMCATLTGAPSGSSKEFKASSVQSCISFCKGKGGKDTAAIRADSECTCLNVAEVTMTETTTCSYPCQGETTQVCGGVDSAGGDVYSTFNIDAILTDYYSCDDLMMYGVVTPSAVYTSSGDYVECLKYSWKSGYIMNAASPLTTTGPTGTSNTIHMDMLNLDAPMYSCPPWGDCWAKVYVGIQYFVEGLVFKGGNGDAIQLSVSVDGQTWQDYGNMTLPPSSNSLGIRWLGLTKPIVASAIIITWLPSNMTSSPEWSMEMMGYSFNQFNFDDVYQGCLPDTNVVMTLEGSGPQYGEMCSSSCNHTGFSALMEPDECYCVTPTERRDPYTTGRLNYKCSGSCFNNTNVCGTVTKGDVPVQFSNMDLTCPTVPDVANATKTTYVMATCSSCGDNVTVATTVTFTCFTGHELSDGSRLTSVITVCLNKGEISVDTSNISCIPIDCGDNPVIADAELVPSMSSNSTLYGETTFYQCSNHTYAFGGINGTEFLNVTCMETGAWLESLVCEEVLCSEPPEVQNGTMLKPPQPWLPGMSYNVNCSDGFWFEPSNVTMMTSNCSIRGWDALPTECIRYRCIVEETTTNNNNLITPYNPTLALETCLSGFEFSDRRTSRNISCNENFLWDTAGVTCGEQSSYYSSTSCLTSLTSVSAPAYDVITARSLVDCATQCLHLPDCSGYNFNKEIMMPDLNCRLFKGAMDSGTSHQDWELYTNNCV